MDNTSKININSLIGCSKSEFCSVFESIDIDSESIFTKVDSNNDKQLTETELTTQVTLMEKIIKQLNGKAQSSDTTASTSSSSASSGSSSGTNSGISSGSSSHGDISNNNNNPATTDDSTALNDKYVSTGALNSTGTNNVNTPFYKDPVRTSSASYADKINAAGLTGEINVKGDGYNSDSGEDVQSLTEKKQSTAAEYDNKIASKETEKTSIVDKNTSMTSELKAQYTSTQSEITQTQSEISQIDSTISSLEAQISSYESNATRLSSELSGINSNQDVSLLDNASVSDETKTKVQASREKRKSNIQSQLNEIQGNIEKANAEKAQAEAQKTAKESQKEALEQTLSEIEREMPDDVQSQISNITSEIQSLKTEKDSAISKIDAQISKAKENEKNTAEFEGKQEGEKTEVTKRALEIATNEETIGYFNNKESEWCVKYASFCYSAAMSEFGINTPLSDKSKGIRALGDAANAGITDNSTLKAGDIIVVGDTKAGDVEGHTGVILEVYPDGSVRTLEGNKDGGKVSSYYLTKEELDKNYYYRYDSADMVEYNAAVAG